MPNVNLIAARRAEKKRIERNTRHLFFGLTAEVGALMLLGTYLGARHLALTGALADAEARLVKLQPTLDRIAKVDKETKELTPKLDTLVSAKSDTMRWRAMLQIVAQSVPNNAWLSGITAQGQGAETTVTLSGTAGSQALIGQAMTNLSSFPIFNNIDLNYTQLSSGPDDPVQKISFEIGAHLKSTRPAPDTGKSSGATATAAAPSKQASEGGPHGRPDA